MASSETGGVQAMSISGRTLRERERMIGMTDEERAWRAKFLKSQELAPEEPITPPGYNKEYYNPLRRFYRAPLNKVEELLTPAVGANAAKVIRYVTAKTAMGIVAIYCTWYYFKYNSATWMSQSGWRVSTSMTQVLPGDPPAKRVTNFASYGFEKSPI